MNNDDARVQVEALRAAVAIEIQTLSIFFHGLRSATQFLYGEVIGGLPANEQALLRERVEVLAKSLEQNPMLTLSGDDADDEFKRGVAVVFRTVMSDDSGPHDSGPSGQSPSLTIIDGGKSD